VNNLRLIRKRLKEVFNDKNILEVLFHWESNARTALRDVVKLLTEISRPAITQDESLMITPPNGMQNLKSIFVKLPK